MATLECCEQIPYLQKNELLKTAVAGTLAGLFFWTIMMPVDNIKTRMQVLGSKDGFLKMFYETFRYNRSAFYNGYGATVGGL